MGLSQAQLCNRLAQMGLEVRQSTLSTWEVGKYGVPIPAMRVLAKALDLDPKYLLGLEEEVWEDDSVAVFYNGLPPEQQQAAKVVLRSMFKAADAEKTTHGKKAE